MIESAAAFQSASWLWASFAFGGRRYVGYLERMNWELNLSNSCVLQCGIWRVAPGSREKGKFSMESDIWGMYTSDGKARSEFWPRRVKWDDVRGT